MTDNKRTRITNRLKTVANDWTMTFTNPECYPVLTKGRVAVTLEFYIGLQLSISIDDKFLRHVNIVDGRAEETAFMIRDIIAVVDKLVNTQEANV